MKVRFKKLADNAKLPKYSREGDAALDMVATDSYFEGDLICYNTGIAVEIPLNHVGRIHPRSSISKYKLRLTNATGIIDSNFRGEIIYKFDKLNNVGPFYQIGDKIGQLIIEPIPHIEPEWADELSETERNTSGWGSSGN